MEKDCIFCNIAHHKTDTEILFEDDVLVVFRDHRPHYRVHLLIVPKKHIRSVNDITDEEVPILTRMMMTGREMAKLENVDKSGYRLLLNVEKGGGQVIFHLHLHLLGGRRL